MGIHEHLVERVYKACGYLPTWPVPDRVEVGEVVTRGAGGIRHETTLRKLLPGESFDLYHEPVPPKEPFVRVVDGVQVEAAGGAGAAPARLTFRFERSFGFLLVVRGGLISRYQELYGVKQAITRLRAAGEWQDDWQLVTCVRSADHCTVLAANDGGVAAAADARVSVPVPVDGLDVAALEISSSVTWHPTRGSHYVVSGGTPLHQALRYKRKKLVDVDRIHGVEASVDDVVVVDADSAFATNELASDVAAGSGEAAL